MPDSGAMAGRAWLAALPEELAAQRRLMAGLIEFCEATPQVTELVVGCSIGRGAADALSDIDGAVGVATEPGGAGAANVHSVEALLATALAEETLAGVAPVVDMLRHRYGPADRLVRRIFAQFADGTQADVVVLADAELRRGDAGPDFVSLYQTSLAPDGSRPTANGKAAGQPGTAAKPGSAYTVTAEQVREWAFLGWCALIDADKYLRRGSLWEAHQRLNETRHHIWQLWAAATGAMYPWHGMTQVLDNDPRNLPPGIAATVAGLDAADLRQAASASAAILASVSDSAAGQWPAELPLAMAYYVTGVLSGAPRNELNGDGPDGS
jgi:predicted nucleotidyltransferase